MSSSIEWPFGGRPRDGGLPEPAPQIVMAANGIYWRYWPDGMHPEMGGIHAEPMFSMVPVSDDNDPVMTPWAVYHLAGWRDHDGTFHPRAADYTERNDER